MTLTGGGCSTIAEAAAGRLGVQLMPNPGTSGPSKLEGVLPAGVDSVQVTDADGAVHTAPVVNGVYTVTAIRPRIVEFKGPNPPAPLRDGA